METPADSAVPGAIGVVASGVGAHRGVVGAEGTGTAKSVGKGDSASAYKPSRSRPRGAIDGATGVVVGPRVTGTASVKSSTEGATGAEEKGIVKKEVEEAVLGLGTLAGTTGVEGMDTEGIDTEGFCSTRRRAACAHDSTGASVRRRGVGNRVFR